MIFIFAIVLHLNRNIKLIRELSGKTQKEFAKLIKTNVSNLKTYENSAVRPKANIIAAICDIAGINPIDLEKRALTHKDIHFKVEKVEIKPPAESVIDANLMAIAQTLARLENGQHYIRAEVRGYGQYQIQQQVEWDQQKFLAAMERVGMLIGANLKAGDLQDKNDGADK